MTDDFLSLQSQSFKKRDVDVYNNNRKSDIPQSKSRKFRWSACFSFISKFKKTKTHQQIRLSQSFDHQKRPAVVQPISYKCYMSNKNDEGTRNCLFFN
jgi:hypothetical protein